MHFLILSVDGLLFIFEVRISYMHLIVKGNQG